jgi:UPF0755 protein
MFKQKKINSYSNLLWRKKTNPFFTMIKLSIVIFIVLWVFINNGYSNFKEKIFTKTDKIIQIEDWKKIEDIAKELNININYLKLYLKYNNPDFKLIAWNFKIEKDSNIQDILEWLSTPIILDEINITLLEWWNIYDMDEYLTKKWLIDQWEYITYVTNPVKIEKLKEFFPFIENQITLEWYLYPDTYTLINEKIKINKLVIKQLETFENKVHKNILSNSSNLEIEKLINLASIVEKEEKNSEEKSTVAGILKKRLDKWWMIWADITVCYPHKLTSEKCKLVVTKYINEKSEYNTRTMKWLPKTPIWNPSFDTINATLNYKETSYWFYLHNTQTGKIYYAKDNAWHEKNKRLYLK